MIPPAAAAPPPVPMRRRNVPVRTYNIIIYTRNRTRVVCRMRGVFRTMRRRRWNRIILLYPRRRKHRGIYRYTYTYTL